MSLSPIPDVADTPAKPVETLESDGRLAQVVDIVVGMNEHQGRFNSVDVVYRVVTSPFVRTLPRCSANVQAPAELCALEGEEPRSSPLSGECRFDVTGDDSSIFVKDIARTVDDGRCTEASCRC